MPLCCTCPSFLSLWRLMSFSNREKGVGSMSSQKNSRLYPLSLATLIGLFLVNTMGFVDTHTASTLGCGREWPLCNGQIIPTTGDYRTAIEYIHRLLVFGDLILLVGLIRATWRRYRQHRVVRVLIGLCLLGFVGESFLGAMAVLFVNPPAVLALHMGTALLSFTGLFLLTMLLKRLERRETFQAGIDDERGPTFTRWVWFTIIYCFLAIYFGAYVSSTGYGAYFQGWPLPDGPYLHMGAYYVDIIHRTIALGLLLLVIRLLILAFPIRHERPDLWKGSLWSVTLVVLQWFSGAFLLETNLSLTAFLIHVTIATFLFCILSLLRFSVASSVTEATIARSKGGWQYESL